MLDRATATTRSRPPSGRIESDVARPASKNENSLTCASPAPTESAVFSDCPRRSINATATSGLPTSTNVSAATTVSGWSTTYNGSNSIPTATIMHETYGSIQPLFSTTEIVVTLRPSTSL